MGFPDTDVTVTVTPYKLSVGQPEPAAHRRAAEPGEVTWAGHVLGVLPGLVGE
jgi:hypothetical protein